MVNILEKYKGNIYTRTMKNHLKFVYLRVTSKISKELSNYTNFEDFLYDRFNDSFLKNQLSYYKGLNITTSKKFVKKEHIKMNLILTFL